MYCACYSLQGIRNLLHVLFEMKKLGILFLVIFLPFWAFSQSHPKHELRAVWIATVGNIDWPSSSNLSTEQQQKEFIELLDLVKKNNMNAVVFQIRPSADAFYPSAIEPWSKWLTGTQGKAPDPYYDPLAFAISECRKRGIDIHVWLNPYRAVSDTTYVVADNHITRLHPEWFLRYGRTTFFDPGLPQTRDYVSRVVSDIVRRYDVDAIHFDDYFYPYRIARLEFPDSSSFARYPNGFPADKKDDWRRNNVNLIIKQLHDSIKAIKPWVEFGISPFGVWRNISQDSTGSNTRAGQTNYDDLFADILKWQQEGWIDYVVPQIYWQIGFRVADYKVLADWWSKNTFGSQLYIGQAPYRVDKKARDKVWRSSKEIIRQIKLNRTYPTISGSMFFSAKVLRRNPQHLNDKLLKKVYQYPSLVPANNRVSSVASGLPGKAELSVSGTKLLFSWEKGSNTKLFVIYKFPKGREASTDDVRRILAVTGDTSLAIPLDKQTDPSKYLYVITSLSVTNLESQPVYFKMQSSNP